MENLEEMARQSMAQFLPGATPPAAPPPAAPPQATTPVAIQAATTPGFDPAQNAVVKTPGGLMETIRQKLAPLGGLGLAAFEAFQLWQDHSQGKEIETEKKVNEVQAKNDLRHDELIAQQEELNKEQQTRIEGLEKALEEIGENYIRPLMERVEELEVELKLLQKGKPAPAAPPSVPHTPTTPPKPKKPWEK